MLPPVLEIYAVWHPADVIGQQIADEFVAHYRGTAFTGLIGGAVEVFIRSSGWRSTADAPRPIPLPGHPLVDGIDQAQFTAVVPLLGNEMAAAVEQGGEWRTYLEAVVASQVTNPAHVGIFPYRLNAGATNGTVLGTILGVYQAIAASPAETPYDTPTALRCRDLSQGIAQLMTTHPEAHLTAFISHTKRSASGEMGDVNALVALVRDVIASTHLREFFDASDLQPGTDWANVLIKKAATSALLALRTDLYPSREWCQREVLTAKRHGMPVVILDAIGYAEERGSFLMDHVPRAPVRYEAPDWKRRDVYRALNLLVDECLKRVLWNTQRDLAAGRKDLDVAWWAPHAPEPVTLAQWLEDARSNGQLPKGDRKLRILHPDPPLGRDEKAVLEQMLALSGLEGRLDVMTPRQLAARGG
jgi:hypothetical protein